MDEVKKRLTARRKLDLYLETRQKDVNLGETLRQYGVHLNDLRQIEKAVERAALDGLRVRRNGRFPKAMGVTSPAEYAALVKELSRKEQALAELTVEYALLKKSERLGSKGRLLASMSTVNGARS